MWGQQLFEAKQKKDPKDQSWLFMKLKNKVKFKKKNGLRSIFGIEATYYIRFHKEGEILGFYGSELKSIERPSLVVLLGSVRGFKKKKNNKIEFSFKNDQDVEFQFEGKADIDKWMKALEFFRRKQKLPPFGIEKWSEIEWATLYFSELDEETQWHVIKDNEILFYKTIEKKFDHDEFIHDKGLTDMFSYNPMSLLQNRILLSGGGFSEADVEDDFDPEFNEEDTLLLDAPPKPKVLKSIQPDTGISSFMGGLIQKTNRYMLMVSNIPIASINQQLFKDDQREVPVEDLNLNHDIDLYKIFAFKYKGKGDYRGHYTTIDLSELDFVYIDACHSGKYKIILGNTFKEYSMIFVTAMEALYWVEAIRKGMELAKRANKVGMQKFIQTVIEIYQKLEEGDKLAIKKTLDDILLDNFQLIEGARQKVLESEDNEEEVFSALKETKGMVVEAIREISFFMDAFVNHTTFNEQLLKFIVFRFGGTMRYFFACYWAILILKAGSLTESMEFIRILNSYVNMLHNWKLSDTVLEKAKMDICFTISSQIFTSSKKAITNLISDVFEPAKKIKGKYQTNFLTKAFGHFNFLTSTCCKFGKSFEEVKPFLLESIDFLMGSAFNHLLMELKKTELNIEQSMALCQTNGMEEFRKFVSTVSGYTGLTAKEIRAKVNRDYFDRCIIRMESIGFNSFLEILKENFRCMLESYAQGIFTFDVSIFLNDFINEHEDLINSADSEQQENIMMALLNLLERRYFDNICLHSHLVSNANFELLRDKLEADFEVVEAFFQLYLGNQLDSTRKFFNEMNIFVFSFDYETIVICLLNLHSLFPDDCTIESIEQLLKIKIHFSDLVKDRIIREFKFYFSKRDSNLNLQKNLNVIVGISSPIIQEFIKILKNNQKKNNEIKELVQKKKEAFSFIYEENAYELMLTQGENEGRGIDTGSHINESQKDFMKNVKVVVNLEDEINLKLGNKVFKLDKFILPAISNWGLIENKFKIMRRQNKEFGEVYLRFDNEVLKTSSDFFGKKDINIYNYKKMENLKKIGSQGFSFVITQQCFAFFLMDKEVVRNRTRTNDADKFVTFIQSRIDSMEKDLYEGVNLHRLQDIDLSEKLGDFQLEIKREPFIYDYSLEREKALEEGKIKVTKGRKESIELDEDLF